MSLCVQLYNEQFGYLDAFRGKVTLSGEEMWSLLEETKRNYKDHTPSMLDLEDMDFDHPDHHAHKEELAEVPEAIDDGDEGGAEYEGDGSLEAGGDGEAEDDEGGATEKAAAADTPRRFRSKRTKTSHYRLKSIRTIGGIAFTPHQNTFRSHRIHCVGGQVSIKLSIDDFIMENGEHWFSDDESKLGRVNSHLLRPRFMAGCLLCSLVVDCYLQVILSG
jgi:hypothetical protein